MAQNTSQSSLAMAESQTSGHVTSKKRRNSSVKTPKLSHYFLQRKSSASSRLKSPTKSPYFQLAKIRKARRTKGKPEMKPAGDYSEKKHGVKEIEHDACDRIDKSRTQPPIEATCPVLDDKHKPVKNAVRITDTTCAKDALTARHEDDAGTVISEKPAKQLKALARRRKRRANMKTKKRLKKVHDGESVLTDDGCFDRNRSTAAPLKFAEISATPNLGEQEKPNDDKSGTNFVHGPNGGNLDAVEKKSMRRRKRRVCPDEKPKEDANVTIQSGPSLPVPLCPTKRRRSSDISDLQYSVSTSPQNQSSISTEKSLSLGHKSTLDSNERQRKPKRLKHVAASQSVEYPSILKESQNTTTSVSVPAQNSKIAAVKIGKDESDGRRAGTGKLDITEGNSNGSEGKGAMRDFDEEYRYRSDMRTSYDGDDPAFLQPGGLGNNGLRLATASPTKEHISGLSSIILSASSPVPSFPPPTAPIFTPSAPLPPEFTVENVQPPGIPITRSLTNTLLEQEHGILQEVSLPISDNKTTKKKTRSKTKKTGVTSLYFAPASGEISKPESTSKRRSNKAGEEGQKKAKRISKGVSVLPWPPLEEEKFGLIQEDLKDNAFQLIVATVFLNKTRGATAIPLLRKFLVDYPTPLELSAANQEKLTEFLQPLGLHRIRAERLIKLAKTWVADPPSPEKGVKKRNYPPNNTKPFKFPPEVERELQRPGFGVERDKMWEIAHLPGVGAYALDSWRIFCRDKFRGVDVDGGAESEWKRVVPMDKELRTYVRWKWAKEGLVWREAEDLDVDTEAEKSQEDKGEGKVKTGTIDNEEAGGLRINKLEQ